MKERLIIAIDGPAGSGKSTVAKEVARRLKLLYIDTGAMYRALTLKAVKEEISLDDEEALIRLAKNTNIELKTKDDFTLQVLLDGEDVSRQIRDSNITNNVKYVARIPGVRKEMLLLQRKAALSGKAVLEGRDIGTVVFPNAEMKIYLDASIEERAKRRYKELIEQGYNITLDEIKKDVETRDHTDRTRDAGPLKKADDAISINTTNLTIDQVAERIIKEIRSCKK